MRDVEENVSRLIKTDQELVEQVIQILLEQETMTGEEIQKIYDEYNLKYAD